MNRNILDIDVQDFIRSYSQDISKLAFSGSPFKGISVIELIQQIESLNKCQNKLPTWFKTRNIYFPPKLNLEQTSSEITAKYKASLIEGNSIADITGGFGIDTFYFSKRFKKVYHFEINEELSAIANHNFEVLGQKNILCSSENGLKAISDKNLDVVFVDPSRRHEHKGKVFFLNDCEPNIPEHLDTILEHCELLIVKTSPMLDISIGLSELKHVFQIHVIAVQNEVKELLWMINKTVKSSLEIKTVNFTNNGLETFNFSWNENAETDYKLPQEFLYEPNAAIMKSGAFNLISEKFKLNKLHKNTHLFTSNKLLEFPGRRFKIEKVVPYKKSDIKSALSFKQANVATRNFPLTVEAIRKKWKIKDGGDIYLFFVTDLNNEKQMLICSKNKF